MNENTQNNMNGNNENIVVRTEMNENTTNGSSVHNDEAGMQARKRLAESIKEFKGLSLTVSSAVFFFVWIFLSLFKGIDGIRHSGYLFLVLTYLVMVHMNSMAFLPAAVVNMKPRSKGRLKPGLIWPAAIGYALLSAAVYTLINMASFDRWGAFRIVIFGIACFALNLFIAYASSFWVWFNYSLPVFAVCLVFTTVCSYLVIHAIARSVIVMFIGLILCMGSEGKNSGRKEYDFQAEMQTACEDFFIIKGAEEWASGDWM